MPYPDDYNEYLEEEMVSLRDPDNLPHLTWADGEVLGKHNDPPKPEYQQMWDEFLNTPEGSSLYERESYDISNYDFSELLASIRQTFPDIERYQESRFLAEEIERISNGQLKMAVGTVVVNGESIESAWNVKQDGTVIDGVHFYIDPNQPVYVGPANAGNVQYIENGGRASRLGKSASSRLSNAWDEQDNPDYKQSASWDDVQNENQSMMTTCPYCNEMAYGVKTYNDAMRDGEMYRYSVESTICVNGHYIYDYGHDPSKEMADAWAGYHSGIPYYQSDSKGNRYFISSDPSRLIDQEGFTEDSLAPIIEEYNRRRKKQSAS
jgi:hypothetical protein